MSPSRLSRLSRLRLRIGRLSVYCEPRDLWVGAYVAPDAVYACPIPTFVWKVER